jgi:hypothetical protein
LPAHATEPTTAINLKAAKALGIEVPTTARRALFRSSFLLPVWQVNHSVAPETNVADSVNRTALEATWTFRVMGKRTGIGGSDALGNIPGRVQRE